eukprot:1193104-Prorocentrum_minimum.AAC.4
MFPLFTVTAPRAPPCWRVTCVTFPCLDHRNRPRIIGGRIEFSVVEWLDTGLVSYHLEGGPSAVGRAPVASLPSDQSQIAFLHPPRLALVPKVAHLSGG